MRTVKLSIESTQPGLYGGVMIDGVDFSSAMRGAKLMMRAGEHARLELDPLIVEVDRLDVEGVELLIAPGAAELLAKAGWFPPGPTAYQVDRPDGTVINYHPADVRVIYA